MISDPHLSPCGRLAAGFSVTPWIRAADLPFVFVFSALELAHSIMFHVKQPCGREEQFAA